MIYDFPTIRCAAPDCGPASNALALKQGIGHNVVVGGNLLAKKVFYLPNIFRWTYVSVLECVENKFATNATARRSDLAEIGRGHFLKIRARCSEFWSMENGLAQS